MTPDAARAQRISDVVTAVAKQMLLDRGAERFALLDDGSTESTLAAEWLSAALGADAVVRVRGDARSVDSLLQPHRAAAADQPRAAHQVERARAEAEVRRLHARLVPGAVVANPANKTALLLGGAPPPDPFFPLGDLYASEVALLAGGWTAPADVREIAAACGGVGPLDDALRGLVDHRNAAALERLGPENRRSVAAALARGRAARVFGTVVPKIGTRTLGVDLFE